MTIFDGDWRAALARSMGLRLRGKDFGALGADRRNVDAIERNLRSPEGRERLRRILDAEGRRPILISNEKVRSEQR